MPGVKTILPDAAVDCDNVYTAGIRSSLQLNIQLI